MEGLNVGFVFSTSRLSSRLCHLRFAVMQTRATTNRQACQQNLTSKGSRKLSGAGTVPAAVKTLLCAAAALLQGLDDAFVSQAPIIEHEQYAEDLYDPSDPTDRQQIEWRETPRAGAAPEGSEAATAPQQQEQEAGGVAEGNGSPAKPASTTGEAASIGSDHTGPAPSEAANGSGKQLSMPAQLQKDAFLVFRALCKLSIRSTEAAPGSEATTIRGKVCRTWGPLSWDCQGRSSPNLWHCRELRLGPRLATLEHPACAGEPAQCCGAW